MAAAEYTYRTVIDEVRGALNMPGSEQVLTDEVILSFIFQHIEQSQTFVFNYKINGTLYVYQLSPDTKIYNLRFTGEDDVEYQVNASGSIRITGGDTGEHSESQITATGCLVWFNQVMADLLYWMATNRSTEAGINVPMGSYTPRTSSELMEMASVWQGITND